MTRYDEALAEEVGASSFTLFYEGVQQMPAGRKGKFEQWLDPDGLLKIQAWARNGLTEAQIAVNMGVGMSTLTDWKVKFPVILAALKKGKLVIDFQVENALLKRALGYKFTEVTRERAIVKDPHSGVESVKLVVTKEVDKEVQPDVTAQIFWLKNRNQKDWRDKRDVEHSGVINNPFEGMTSADLKKLIEDDE